MNSKCGGVYTITSKISGKRYVGSSVTINKRWMQHVSKLKNNKHTNPYLQNHFNKYGEDDLLFNVVEIIKRDNLSLSTYKKLLLDTEQKYLDNWDCCEFNCLKIAGSNLGYKQRNKKYYCYVKSKDKYKVTYIVFGKPLSFGFYKTEQQAKDKVAFIKNLTEQEQFDLYTQYQKDNKNPPRGRGRKTKGYCYCKKSNRWVVKLTVIGTKRAKHFGTFKTEEEAKIKAEEIKKQLDKSNELI